MLIYFAKLSACLIVAALNETCQFATCLLAVHVPIGDSLTSGKQPPKVLASPRAPYTSISSHYTTASRLTPIRVAEHAIFLFKTCLTSVKTNYRPQSDKECKMQQLWCAAPISGSLDAHALRFELLLPAACLPICFFKTPQILQISMMIQSKFHDCYVCSKRTVHWKQTLER